jgi:hypothetical protein
MNASNTSTGFERRRVVLSTLWIFAVLNYIYADVYTLFFNPVLKPEAWKAFLAGGAGGIQITPGFVLITAVLMETAIAMVLLSRVLPYRANRWANILSAAFHTLFVAWALIGETPTAFFLMFAAIEVVTTLFITGYAWKWPAPARQGTPVNQEERSQAVVLG